MTFKLPRPISKCKCLSGQVKLSPVIMPNLPDINLSDDRLLFAA